MANSSESAQKTLTLELINAYRKWKANAYYDSFASIDANRIADFEYTHNIRDNNRYFANIAKKLLDPLQRKELFDEICSLINIRCFPKTNPTAASTNQSNLISNTSFSPPKIEKLQYMIDLPIIGHVISILWVMKIGYQIDFMLSEEIHGDRLKQFIRPDNDSKATTFLFEQYFQKYASWRDEAIRKTEEILDSKNNAIIISLDIKGFYYNCRIDFDNLREYINFLSFGNESYDFLTDFIEQVFITYSSKFDFLDDYEYQNPMIPIGFLPSKIIANWYLQDFDKAIHNLITPEYYGRYVDDLLLVFKIEDQLTEYEATAENIIKKLIITNYNIFYYPNKSENNLYINSEYTHGSIHPLQIGSDKSKVFYFSHNKNREILNSFKENIKRHSSVFVYLDEENDLVTNFSHEVLKIEYSDTLNKIRSIEDLQFDRHNLSVWLSKIEYFSGSIADSQIAEISIKFKEIFESLGATNIYNFWEKIFTFLYRHNSFEDLTTLIRATIYEIDTSMFSNIYSTGWKLKDKDENDKLHSTLTQMLQSIIEKVLSLRNTADSRNLISKIRDLFPESSGFLKDKYWQKYLYSFMFNNKITAFPLFDFLTLKDDFDLFTFQNGYNRLDKQAKIKYLSLYPRFIHFFEIQLFILGFPKFIGILDRKNQYDFAWKLYWELNYHINKVSNNPITVENIDSISECIQVGPKEKKETIRIGIANVIVNTQNYESALEGKSLFDSNTRDEITRIVNTAINQKVDILVLPECYINFSWVTKLISVAEKQQIGVIFGLEYIIKDNQANNYLMCILPYKLGSFRNSAIDIRLKNHYSPGEIGFILKKKLSVPINRKSSYVMYQNKGISFAPYLCFEIASIGDRGIFKSRIDAIIVVEWNPDTEYFSNIIESLSRDLHCYCIQVNSSNYGDSRITQPMKSYAKDIVRAKGGENAYLIVDTIQIEKLRNFQEKYEIKELEYKPKSEDTFKPLPPDFNKAYIKKR